MESSVMTVTCTGEEKFLGLVDPSVRWNGFLCPRFSRDEANKVAEWINSEDTGYTATWVEDTLFVTNNNFDTPYTDTYEKDKDNLYSIGAFGWTWMQVR